MCRYHLNLKEKCLIDGKTGEVLRPSCFDDLAAMYSYFIGSGQEKQAEEMIKEVFRGEKVITKMIAKYQDMTGNHPRFDSSKKYKDKRSDDRK